jgi:hypothetical protein
MNLTEEAILAASNAMVMASSAVLILVLVEFALKQVGSIRGFFHRSMESFKGRGQGDAYEFSIALMVILLGFGIRAEAAWAWRVMGYPLKTWQLIGGAILAVVGVLCLIRIAAPASRFRLYFWSAIAITGAFAWVTFYLDPS